MNRKTLVSVVSILLMGWISQDAFGQDMPTSVQERSEQKSEYLKTQVSSVHTDQEKAKAEKMRQARELKKQAYLIERSADKKVEYGTEVERKAAKEARLRRIEIETSSK